MSHDPEFSDELVEKIFAYVEREVGRDAPLSPEDETMVRELLLRDRVAQKLADEFRNLETSLNAMFLAGADMPVREDLVRRIRAHGESAGETE